MSKTLFIVFFLGCAQSFGSTVSRLELLEGNEKSLSAKLYSQLLVKSKTSKEVICKAGSGESSCTFAIPSKPAYRMEDFKLTCLEKTPQKFQCTFAVVGPPSRTGDPEGKFLVAWVSNQSIASNGVYSRYSQQIFSLVQDHPETRKLTIPGTDIDKESFLLEGAGAQTICTKVTLKIGGGWQAECSIKFLSPSVPAGVEREVVNLYLGPKVKLQFRPCEDGAAFSCVLFAAMKKAYGQNNPDLSIARTAESSGEVYEMASAGEEKVVMRCSHNSGSPQCSVFPFRSQNLTGNQVVAEMSDEPLACGKHGKCFGAQLGELLRYAGGLEEKTEDVPHNPIKRGRRRGDKTYYHGGINVTETRRISGSTSEDKQGIACYGHWVKRHAVPEDDEPAKVDLPRPKQVDFSCEVWAPEVYYSDFKETL